MEAEVRLFEAWRVPAWDDGGAGPDVATRVLPAARARGDEPPGLALAVPELTGRHVDALANRLRERRAELLDRPVSDVVRAVDRVADRFLDPSDALRARALEVLPASSGLSPAMCRLVLDGMARDWTAERLDLLIGADFGGPAPLDGFDSRGLRALGADLAFHVSAGSVPGVSATSMVRSLLVKTPVLVKPGRGDVALPVLLLDALAEEDPALARAAAVIYWPGGAEGSAETEEAALAGADLVVVYGGDETVADLRRRTRPNVPVLAYHHRVSFGVVGADALTPDRLPATADAAALAVATFDQRGCVSPHVLFVEDRDGGARDGLVSALAAALERLETELPPGRPSDGEASALQQLRGTTEMRVAAGEALSMRSGGRAAWWTVLVEPGAGLVPSCLNRVVRVVPVEDVGDVPDRVRDLGPHLQTAGVAGVDGDRLVALAEDLARAGVLRVAPLEGMAFPPAWWRHDGRGPLDALVRWVELERP